MPENSARHQIAGPVTSPLLYTPIPWVARQDEDGKWQKVPAIGYGWHYRDFAYGVPVIPFSEWGFEGYDRLGNEIWRDVQPGYVVSPRSGVIVLDQDRPGFFEWLASIGIELPDTGPLVSTGKPDGLHRVFDGRHLTDEQWPKQRNYLGLGDVKSHGFCAAPGAVHPSGRRYELVRPGAAPRWDPEWTLLQDDWWAARPGRGRASGRARRGERASVHAGSGQPGSGRNCELYDRKKYLFYEQGIDEDDPEMERLILEANQEFAVPMSEARVLSTVLQIKGWMRRWRHGGELAIGEQEEDEEMASRREALRLAFRGETAGQEIFLPLELTTGEEEDPEGVEKFSDLREREPELPADPLRLRPLRTERQILAKHKAENDPHPKSRDWDGAPEGAMECYEALIDSAIRAVEGGAPLAQVRTEGCPAWQPDGPWCEQLAYLLHGDGVPLIELAGGLITLLGDPESDPKDPYPGVPEGVNPKAGKSFGTKLDDLILIIRSCEGGDKLTQREIATIINHASFREAFGLNEHRYASVGSLSKHHVKLRKKGTIRIIEKAVRYRENRQWRLESAARYKTCLHLPEDNELALLVAATRHLIRDERAASRQERLELAA